MMYIVYGLSIDNFIPSEFHCNCPDKNCEAKKMDWDDIHPDLIYNLQKLRSKLAKPLQITSGARCIQHHYSICEKYNLPLTTKSKHIFGDTPERLRAADIKCKHLTTKELYMECEKLGFRGIGYYSGHVHVDVADRDQRWSVDKDTRKYKYLF